MKQVQRSVLVLSALLAACQSTSSRMVGDDGSASDQSEYRVVHGWPLLPEGYILGQATGVAVDSRNNVYVFHRAGRE